MQVNGKVFVVMLMYVLPANATFNSNVTTVESWSHVYVIVATLFDAAVALEVPS